MGITLTDVLLFGKAQSDDVDNATLVIYRRNILRWSALGGYLDIVVRGVAPLSLPDAIANSLSYVKAFGGTEQRNLPDGYTELEYIESTGTQYIDTGIVPNNKTRWELDNEFTAINLPDFSFNGIYQSNPIFRFDIALSNTNLLLNYGNTNNVSSAPNNFLNNRMVYKVDAKSGTWAYGSTTGTLLGYTFVSNNKSIYLFARNDHLNSVDTVSRFSNQKTYSSKIYQDDVLVQNLVPAKRDSDSKIGMYDLVSGQFFTNQGTGDFVAGGEAVPTPDTPMDIVSNNGVLKYSRNKANVIADNVVVGKYISAQGVLSDSENNFTYMPYVPVKPNTTYTLSLSSPVYFSSVSEYSSAEDAGFVVRQVKYSTSLDAPFDLTEFTFTTGATTNYVRFDSNMYKNQTLTIDDVLALNYMLAESATAVPYAPYVSVNGGIYTDGTIETIKDSLNNTATAEMLLKVGDYQDVQSIIDGAVTRNVGMKVLDGTEAWSDGTSPNVFLVFVSNKKPGKFTSFCNYYTYSSTSQSGLTHGTFGMPGSGLSMFFKDGRFSTASDFATWLADQYANGTPVIVLYPLATPTTESVAGQALQVTDGDNVLEITQASLNGLELEAEYQAAVSLTIQEVQDANLDPNVEVTIS